MTPPLSGQKTNPIQTQTNPISQGPEVNVNSILTKDYENICPCGAPKNKPKTNPISSEPKNERKLITNRGLSESALRSVPENRPNLETALNLKCGAEPQPAAHQNWGYIPYFSPSFGLLNPGQQPYYGPL